MVLQVRFECGVCGEGFVDWHEDDWQRAPAFCVYCGAPSLVGVPIESAIVTDSPSPDSEGRPARTIGVPTGDDARLPGLKEEPTSENSEVADASPDTEPILPQSSPGRSSTQATSTAPKANVRGRSAWAARRRKLEPVGALLLGFVAGIPAALMAENPVLRLAKPAAYARQQLTEQFRAISGDIDEGNWDRARELLDRCASAATAGDHRPATLRARLTLGLILANRPADAGRELAAVKKAPFGHPSAADLERAYDALFPVKPSAAANNSGAPQPAASAAPPKAKVTVTKRELLTFARDRQHRAQLDDAERLYGEVLRTHPNDAEARCGLAEVQILRGGMDDGAKLFERALSDNASYLPAWVGLADVDWLRGHPERAACRYQAVIDRFPTSSYPPYITQRVLQVTNSGVNPPKARADVSAADACDG